MSDSLQPHGLQHARLPYLSLSEFVQTHVHWVTDAILPSHSLLPSSPAAFILSQHHGLFQWVSSSHQVTQVLEFKLQHQSFQWIFRVDFLRKLIWSPCSPRDSQASSPAPQFKSISSLTFSLLFGPNLSSIHVYCKNHKNFDYIDLCWKVMCQLFNTLPRFVIASLPRSKSLLISWLQSPSAMILEPKKRIYVTASTFSPSICYERIGLDAMILVFWMLNCKPAFSLSSFILIKRLFSSSSLSAKRMVSSTYLRLWYFSQQSWVH